MTKRRIDAETAKSLAITYNAYNAARAENNNLSIRVWGRKLIDLQEETGIELHNPYWVEFAIKQASAATEEE